MCFSFLPPHAPLPFRAHGAQLVGASASECDTIPGRQCMASCFFLLKQFEDVNIYLNSVKVIFSTVVGHLVAQPGSSSCSRITQFQGINTGENVRFLCVSATVNSPRVIGESCE